MPVRIEDNVSVPIIGISSARKRSADVRRRDAVSSGGDVKGVQPVMEYRVRSGDLLGLSNYVHGVSSAVDHRSGSDSDHGYDIVAAVVTNVVRNICLNNDLFIR